MATLHKFAEMRDGRFVEKLDDATTLVVQGHATGAWVRVENVTPQDGVSFHLEELYEMLGCEIVEVINLLDGTILICDEMPPGDSLVNPVPTRLYQAVGGDRIVGNALHCRDEELR